MCTQWVYFPCVCCAAELMCNRTWDGWLCWDDVEAGNTVTQHCPDYYKDFDTSGKKKQNNKTKRISSAENLSRKKALHTELENTVHCPDLDYPVCRFIPVYCLEVRVILDLSYKE